MKISSGIALIAILPSTAFTPQSARVLCASLGKRGLDIEMDALTSAARGFSGVVHELQRERGLSSLCLAGGVGMDAVSDQRGKSDRASDAAKELVDAATLPEAVRASFASSESALTENSKLVRDRAPADQVRGAHTGWIRGRLDVERVALSGRSSDEINTQWSAILILEMAKESSGQMRALVSGVLAQDKPRFPEQQRAAPTINLAIAVLLEPGRFHPEGQPHTPGDHALGEGQPLIGH